MRIEILLNFLCDVDPVASFKCTAIWCLELEISNTLFLCFREILSIIFNLIFFFIRVLRLVFVRVNQHISYKVFTWLELKLSHHVFGCALVLTYNTSVFEVGWVAVAVEVIGIIAIITIESEIYFFDVHNIPLNFNSFHCVVFTLDWKFTSCPVASDLGMVLEVKGRRCLWIYRFNFDMLLFVAV